jgi:hypothetical protein
MSAGQPDVCTAEVHGITFFNWVNTTSCLPIYIYELPDLTAAAQRIKGKELRWDALYALDNETPFNKNTKVDSRKG